jgi:hypothetical protein
MAHHFNGIIEVGVVDILQLFLLQSPKALRVEGGQDCSMLRVAVERLLLAHYATSSTVLASASAMNASFY